LLDVVGRVYNVHLVETVLPDDGRTLIGWHPSVRIFQVLDGPSGGRSHRCLGFVYLDLYMRTSMFGRPTVAVPGAQVMCRSHAYVNMGLMAAPYGQKKLFASEEMVAIAHEMGHAVHMLCHPGTFDELADQPLDLLEMPSVLAETVALHPGTLAHYARHHTTGGPPPEALTQNLRDASFYVQFLQDYAVTLGLHGDSFDPHSASPSDVQSAAASFWGRYSAVPVHDSFSPFGGNAGLYVAGGANQLAYLLCYLRVHTLLHSRTGREKTPRDVFTRWQKPEFASMLRSQLLERDLSGRRLAQLLPPLSNSFGGKPLAHPLPKHLFDTSSLFQHTANV